MPAPLLRPNEDRPVEPDPLLRPIGNRPDLQAPLLSQGGYDILIIWSLKILDIKPEPTDISVKAHKITSYI